MRKPIIAGNWKMHKTIAEAVEFVNEIKGKLKKFLNENFKEVKYEDTEIYSLYKMYLDRPNEIQERLFD